MVTPLGSVDKDAGELVREQWCRFWVMSPALRGRFILDLVDW